MFTDMFISIAYIRVIYANNKFLLSDIDDGMSSE